MNHYDHLMYLAYVIGTLTFEVANLMALIYTLYINLNYMLKNGYNEATLKIVTTLLLLALASVLHIVQFSVGFQAFSHMQLHVLFLVYLVFQIPMYVMFSFTETPYMRTLEVKVKHSIISFLVSD